MLSNAATSFARRTMPERTRSYRTTGEQHCAGADRSSAALPPSLRHVGLVWQLLCSLLFVASILSAAPMASFLSERTSRANKMSAHTLNLPLASLSASESELGYHESSGSVQPLPSSTPPPLVALSPLLFMAPRHHHPFSRNALVSVFMQPLVLELGAVVLCQAVGLPLLSKLGVMLRRVRVPSHLLLKGTAAMRRIPVARTMARHVKVASGRAWKAFGHVYKQTSLSKIVNRSKKLLKVFVHHPDHSHDNEEGSLLKAAH